MYDKKILAILLGKENDSDENVFPSISIRSEDKLQLLKYAPFYIYSPLTYDYFRKTMCTVENIKLINSLLKKLFNIKLYKKTKTYK